MTRLALAAAAALAWSAASAADFAIVRLSREGGRVKPRQSRVAADARESTLLSKTLQFVTIRHAAA